eukprot:scaffold145_cov261-Pinguiococcus_pyrenoidosus.AAC.8
MPCCLSLIDGTTAAEREPSSSLSFRRLSEGLRVDCSTTSALLQLAGPGSATRKPRSAGDRSLSAPQYLRNLRSHGRPCPQSSLQAKGSPRSRPAASSFSPICSRAHLGGAHEVHLHGHVTPARRGEGSSGGHEGCSESQTEHDAHRRKRMEKEGERASKRRLVDLKPSVAEPLWIHLKLEISFKLFTLSCAWTATLLPFRLKDATWELF